MKKEILLLSSLISFALICYIGLPNKKDTVNIKEIQSNKIELEKSLIDEIFDEAVILKFDLVRLDPKGDVIIAGKTKPNIEVDIYDGNQKLSSVISDSHGDWVWMSKKGIENGLKRFHLKHIDSDGNVIHSDENIIVFFEKDIVQNQKVVKVFNKKKLGIEILNRKEIEGLSLDSVEHFANNTLRIQGRSMPNSEVKLIISGKTKGKLIADNIGNWEFNTGNIEFDNYDLVIESILKNNILSLKTKILNGKVKDDLSLEKKFIVEDGNSLWRIARRTLGGGIHYAEIYKNNKKIIHNPDLIFPGQVFKIPNLKHTSLYE